MLFRTKEDAYAFVSSVVFLGSYFLGRLMYVFLWLTSQLVSRLLGKITKVHGVSNLWTLGPVIYVSNHMDNWDFLRIVLHTNRHVRPVYKDSAFENPWTKPFIVLGGAMPIVQTAKEGDPPLSREQQVSNVYLIKATRFYFQKLIRRGWAGLIFVQGTRQPEGSPIGPLSPGIFPLFQHEGTDPLIVAIGITSKTMVVHAGVRLSEFPSDKSGFLIALQNCVQAVQDEAVAKSI